MLLASPPKRDDTREEISRIHLWIDQSDCSPLKQRICHGSSDTHLAVTYDNVSRNDSLSREVYKPKWPKGTENVNP